MKGQFKVAWTISIFTFLIFSLENCAVPLADKPTNKAAGVATPDPSATPAPAPAPAPSPTPAPNPLAAQVTPPAITLSQKTAQVTATGGTAPYFYMVMSGPATVDAQGLLTATATGTVVGVASNNAGGSVPFTLKVNADPLPATKVITVSTSACNGAKCKGAYGGSKYAITMLQETLNYLCSQQGYTTGSDWTFTNNQPGGEFCYLVNANFSCDGSCSGCNPMDSVTCSGPVAPK